MTHWVFPPLGETLAKVAVSFVLAALVGWERLEAGRPAGLRTHVLVCLGSCLFMMLSASIAGQNYDPARIAAQVVTGMGFLGAGTIMRSGNVIRGLTTAASLWAIAAVGLAVGAGWYWGAVLFTAVQFITLSVFRRVEHRIHVKAEDLHLLELEVRGTGLSMDGLRQRVAALKSDIRSAQFTAAEGSAPEHVQMSISAPADADVEQLADQLRNLPGVHEVEWHSE